jgi:hypothetical protein
MTFSLTTLILFYIRYNDTQQNKKHDTCRNKKNVTLSIYDT